MPIRASAVTTSPTPGHRDGRRTSGTPEQTPPEHDPYRAGEPSDRSPWIRRPWALLVALTVTVTLVNLTGPIGDVDAYWHVLLGYDILTERRVTGDPAWIFGPHQDDWVSTQWAAEVVMAAAHAALGWTGLTLLTVLCALATLAGLAAGTLRGGTGFPIRAVVFALAGFALAADIQERPAAISFVFLTLLAAWCHRALRAPAAAVTWPAWWLLALFTLTWAQFHGYWVLTPVAVTAVALIRALAHRTVSGWLPQTALAAVTSLVGGLSPAGLTAYTAPVTVKAAAAPWIEEWSPTRLNSGSACALLALAVLFLAVTWLPREQRRLPLAETLWLGLWLLFASLAYRNVTPAVLLLAPVIAAHAARRLPNWQQHARGTALTGTLIVAVALAGIGAATGRTLTGDPLPAWTPYRAYAAVDTAPGERRIVNFYDYGGQTLALTRPGIRVVVDGRADLYGPEHLADYFAVITAEPGWRETFRAWDATDVLIPADVGLSDRLPGLGWRRVLTDGEIELWQPRR